MHAQLVELLSELCSEAAVAQGVVEDTAFMAFLVDECCLPAHLSHQSTAHAAFLSMRLAETEGGARQLLSQLCCRDPLSYGQVLALDSSPEHAHAQTNVVGLLLALLPSVSGLGESTGDVIHWMTCCTSRLKSHLLSGEPTLVLATVLFLEQLLELNVPSGPTTAELLLEQG